MLAILHKASDNPAPAEPTNSWQDLLPSLGGIGGGILGHIAGSVEPGLGNIFGGAALSGLGGGLGESIRQLINGSQGQSPDWSQIPKSAGAQAAFGAIPGGDEVKALPLLGKLGESLAGRTALRFGGGYLGGDIANQIQNAGTSGGQNSNGAGLATGAINAILPGVGAAVTKPVKSTFNLLTEKIPTRVVGELGTRAEKTAQIGLDRLASLFGNKVIDTTGTTPIINPAIKPLLDRFGLATEPSIQQIGGKLKDATSTIETQLKPVLDKPYYAVRPSEVKELVDNVVSNTVGDFGHFGQSAKDIKNTLDNKLSEIVGEATPIKSEPSQGGLPRNTAGNNPLFTNQTISGNITSGTETPSLLSLSNLLKLKRFVGEKADWNNTPFGRDPFQQLYSGLDNLMKAQLTPEDLSKYGHAMADHSNLIQMKSAYDRLLQGRLLPDVVKNPNLVGKELNTQPLNEPLLSALGTILGGTGGALLGEHVLGPIGGLAGGAGGIYGGQAATRALLKDPEMATALMDKLSKFNQLGNSTIAKGASNIGELIRQLGIRLPSAITP